MRGHVVLVGFFPRAVQAPIVSIQVQFDRLPGRRMGVGLGRHIADERVLDFRGPHMLSSVADVDVVQLCQPRFFREQRPIQIPCVHPFEIKAEGFLRLRARPAAMDFQVQFFSRGKGPEGVEPLHPCVTGPRLPKVGPEEGVVVRGVGPQFVHPLVPVEQVVWRNQHRDDGQFVVQRVDEVALVLCSAGKHVVEVGERLHAQDRGGVGGQPIVRECRGRGAGHRPVQRVPHLGVGDGRGQLHGLGVVVKPRRHRELRAGKDA